MSNLTALVPLAVVMVAGPQIISAIMLATSEKAYKNSFAYVGGAMLATVLMTSVFYIVVQALSLKAPSGDSGSVAVDWVFVAILIVVAVHTYLKRSTAEPPKWMGKLEGAGPALAFLIGLLLFVFMPGDLVVTFTVGASLASTGQALWQAAGFWLLTALFIGSPLLVLLLMGKRADVVLPKMRDWMTKNSWVVSEAVIGFFLVMEIVNIVGA